MNHNSLSTFLDVKGDGFVRADFYICCFYSCLTIMSTLTYLFDQARELLGDCDSIVAII